MKVLRKARKALAIAGTTGLLMAAMAFPGAVSADPGIDTTGPESWGLDPAMSPRFGHEVIGAKANAQRVAPPYADIASLVRGFEISISARQSDSAMETNVPNLDFLSNSGSMTVREKATLSITNVPNRDYLSDGASDFQASVTGSFTNVPNGDYLGQGFGKVARPSGGNIPNIAYLGGEKVTAIGGNVPNLDYLQ